MEVSPEKTRVVNVKRKYSEFLGFEIKVNNKSNKKMISGIQNYYRLATKISMDARKLNKAVMEVITNRLKGLSRKGRKLTSAEKSRYGKSKMIRYVCDEPIYPIGYVQFKVPIDI